jgi:amino-acid N-acetyltransferase
MIRKAGIGDAKTIQKLINAFASQDLMLPRSLNEIFENIRDFWVALDNGRVVGCGALHIVGWDNMAEIKSLAVNKKFQKKGFGALLMRSLLEEAAGLEIQKVFALSYQPKFFKKFGFRTVPKSKLPHKIWAECCHCPKFPNCGEIALVKTIR